MSVNMLPPPQRYITTNDDDGTSTFSTAVSESVPVARDLGSALLRFGYATDPPLPALTGEADLKLYSSAITNPPELVRPAGFTNVWYVDMPPDSESPWHRTTSLDFVIQVQGEMELTLASGEQRVVKPGDMTIQRSTMHRWRNRSKTQWSRMVGVMTGVQPVVTGKGAELGTEFLAH